MKIYSVSDSIFNQYGRVVTGYDMTGIMAALEKTPCTAATVYTARDEALQHAEGARTFGDGAFGGMPYQIGWCNGRNTMLNCLEYHRDSEFNIGTEDFVLMLAKQWDIEGGKLDTSKVKAFFCPKGTLIEVYATTLHYAPCHVDKKKGFRVMVALPLGTNTDICRTNTSANTENGFLWARNKWLLAHEESDEAKQGAAVALTGKNIDLAKD